MFHSGHATHLLMFHHLFSDCKGHATHLFEHSYKVSLREEEEEGRWDEHPMEDGGNGQGCSKQQEGCSYYSYHRGEGDAPVVNR